MIDTMGLDSSFHIVMPLTLSFIALLLLLFSFWFAWPWTSHAFRQASVHRNLHRLEKKGAQILHNLILPDRKGGSVWIDYLIITNHSITAVELMACSGQIFGSPHDATWVQERGHTRYRFPNPLRQSNQAANAIKNILGKFTVQEALIYSGCELHDSMPANVLKATEIESFLMQAQTERKLSATRRDWISNTLKQLSIQDAELTKAHEKAALEGQGDIKHLQMSKRIMLASCGIMTLAVGLVILHVLTR